MNRRAFFSLPIAAWLASRLAPRTTYGYVDVNRAFALGIYGCRVLIDGVDVTDRCRAFHDRIGFVELLEHNEHGHPYLIGDSVATCRRYGTVTIRRPRSASLTLPA